MKKQKIAKESVSNKEKIKKISNYESFDDWAADIIKQDGIDEYLKISFDEYAQDGDEKALLITLRQIAKARGGFKVLSSKTGIKRESLYRALSAHGNPRLHTITAILHVFGYSLILKPVHQIAAGRH